MVLAAIAVSATGRQVMPNLSFDAATLKQTDDSEGGVFLTYPGGRVTVKGLTLKMLIVEAYNIQQFQVLNAPAWVDEIRYHIDAVPPAIPKLANYNPSNPKVTPPDEVLEMLRNFLADRFHLKTHEETTDGPGYALVRGDKPLRLNEPKDKNAYPVFAGGRTDTVPAQFYRRGINVSMAGLASSLSSTLAAPVVDQTGIVGSFDFQFDYAPDPSNPSPGAYLFSAMEPIGLKLKSAKVPSRKIVVDHVEKPKLE